jgi:hypothetical protein
MIYKLIIEVLVFALCSHALVDYRIGIGFDSLCHQGVSKCMNAGFGED